MIRFVTTARSVGRTILGCLDSLCEEDIRYVLGGLIAIYFCVSLIGINYHLDWEKSHPKQPPWNLLFVGEEKTLYFSSEHNSIRVAGQWRYEGGWNDSWYRLVDFKRGKERQCSDVQWNMYRVNPLTGSKSYVGTTPRDCTPEVPTIAKILVEDPRFMGLDKTITIGQQRTETFTLHVLTGEEATDWRSRISQATRFEMLLGKLWVVWTCTCGLVFFVFWGVAGFAMMKKDDGDRRYYNFLTGRCFLGVSIIVGVLFVCLILQQYVHFH